MLVSHAKNHVAFRMPPRQSPPLAALRSFEAAARKLSFAEAAHELFVTPAAVSHQIKRLEEYMGMLLFERHNRAVVLTETGAKLAATLHTLFAALDDALTQIKEPTGPRIRVSALPSLAAKWLVPRLYRFEAAHPALKVRIETSDHLVNFAYEPIDIALRYGVGNYPGLHVERLMSADAFPVCSPRVLGHDHPPLKKATDLRRHTLLHDESSDRSKGVPNWAMWLKAAGAIQVDSRRGPVFGSIHLAIEAALAGHGVAMGIAPLVEHDLRSGRLIRPFELKLPNAFSFWFVCQPKRASDPIIRKFRNWLRHEANPER
jgi:LysR family transcriptional regulator, glycine cleavage system transcriptional activator